MNAQGFLVAIRFMVGINAIELPEIWRRKLGGSWVKNARCLATSGEIRWPVPGKWQLSNSGLAGA